MTEPAGISAIHAEVARYYRGKLLEHGPTARGVDWRDEAGQMLRHRQFDRLIDADPSATIADLGCGYGDYFAYLRAKGHTGGYVGYDLAAEMVHAAETLHGASAKHAWQIGAMPAEPADYVVASGIFNVKGSFETADWGRYVADTVDMMAGKSRKGFGFNMLSAWCDPDKRRPDLYYAQPSEWFDHCARHYGRKVAVLQDYGLYEFTLICRLGSV